MINADHVIVMSLSRAPIFRAGWDSGFEVMNFTRKVKNVHWINIFAICEKHYWATHWQRAHETFGVDQSSGLPDQRIQTDPIVDSPPSFHAVKKCGH